MSVMVDRDWGNKQSSSGGLSPRAQFWRGQAPQFSPMKKLALSVVEGGA